MSNNAKDGIWVVLGVGARVGLMGSVLSAISKEFIKESLGYALMGIKNTIKVMAVSSVRTVGVLWGIDKYRDWNKKGSGGGN